VHTTKQSCEAISIVRVRCVTEPQERSDEWTVCI